MNEGKNQDNILAIGVGNSGCKILSALEQKSDLYNFAYISSNSHDFPQSSNGMFVRINLKLGGNISPRMIRSFSQNQLVEISTNIKDADCVILTCDPGENISSALTPVILKMCSDQNIKCLSVISMPYEHEKHRHFNAGVTLTKIKQYSNHTIIIDNDEVLESLPRIPISKAFDLIYSKIALLLSSLFYENSDGLASIFEITDNDKYSILSFGESLDDNNTELAIKNALNMLSNTTNPSSISRVFLFINGNTNLSTTDVISSINMIKGQVSNDAPQISHSYSISNGSNTTAILISSGLTKTKFDDYDPISRILNNNNIDTDIEYYIDEELEIPILPD